MKPILYFLILSALSLEAQAQLFGKFSEGLGKVINGTTNTINSSYNITVDSFSIYDALVSQSDIANQSYGFKQELETNQYYMRQKMYNNSYYNYMLQQEITYLGARTELVKTSQQVALDARNDALSATSILVDFKNYLDNIENKYNRANTQLKSYNDKIQNIQDNYKKMMSSIDEIGGGLLDMKNSKLGKTVFGKGAKGKDTKKTVSKVGKMATKIFGGPLGTLFGDSAIDTLMGGDSSKEVSDEKAQELAKNQLETQTQQLTIALTNQKLNYKNSVSLDVIARSMQAQELDRKRAVLEKRNRQLAIENDRIKRETLLLNNRIIKRNEYAEYLARQ